MPPRARRVTQAPPHGWLRGLCAIPVRYCKKKQEAARIMRYPELMIHPMREELTRHGVEEARTPEDVDRVLAPGSGHVLMVVNSVCGCAAGCARPGVVRSLQGETKPDKIATVFAGADLEATAHLRQKLSMYPPSSPSFALFRDGEPVYVMHRHQIEGREAASIAADLQEAYRVHCGAEAAVGA